ncbi:ArsR/SmtB family transcription factor [Phycicoccus flavus]|uniref:ArsR/SmtB family transcription factor n=1 Tax=Phycicoccus flavus TaxID=2502783 RepID=UPI000FEBA1EE|nr:helix-turn-helix domain-containing protein [Phycicoccus flavus]NHA67366.1 winged helix-turn-helix transcriptional regulator [Phycicoccus flavus]
MAPDDRDRLRALAHPLRLRILSLLTGADLTAADVARELGTTHANASYHLRFLENAGEVVVSGEETIRGGRAKRYRHHWRGVEGSAGSARAPGATPGERREAADLFVRAAAGEVQRRYAERVPDSGGLVTDAELWVDDDTWARARALLEEASALVHDRALPPRTEGARRVGVSLFAFEMGERA